MIYADFIETKAVTAEKVGFEPTDLNSNLFEHQAAIVRWACRRGRAGVFLDTGLGKTLTQLAWADQVVNHTKQSVIVVTPLAVAHQTVREAEKFGIEASYAADNSKITNVGIYVTNYERLKNFDLAQFSGVVLDESSILKGFNGKLRKEITNGFADTPYRLSCTATPSPNDYIEIGTQSEFLGVMPQQQMLAMYFIHDTGGGTNEWRMKNHAKGKFWRWIATWAVFMRSPADLGFHVDGYDLPPIEYHDHIIQTAPQDGVLFVMPAQSLTERNKARKDTLQARCEKAASIVNQLDEPCVVWCHLNDESSTLASLINGAVEVKGSDTPEHKSKSMLDFADGKIKCLITKPKIAGFGMNWQTSRHCVFVGLSDSWESFYQAIRRQWRFGQDKTVHCHVVSSDVEGAVLANIKRKDAKNEEMLNAMAGEMREFTQREIFGATIDKADYLPTETMLIPEWLTEAA